MNPAECPIFRQDLRENWESKNPTQPMMLIADN